MVHVHNGILLSHKKEWNCIICRDVDEPRDCLTKWSKLEREKQMSYVHTYMCNLEKWYRWSYCKTERPRDKEQTWTPRGVRGGGMNGEIEIDKYIPLILCKI